MIFTLDSIHQKSQTYLIQQNIFTFIMSYFFKNISIYIFYFFIVTIFGFNPAHSLIGTPTVSSFILLTNNLIELL